MDASDTIGEAVEIFISRDLQEYGIGKPAVTLRDGAGQGFVVADGGKEIDVLLGDDGLHFLPTVFTGERVYFLAEPFHVVQAQHVPVGPRRAIKR